MPVTADNSLTKNGEPTARDTPNRSQSLDDELRRVDERREELQQLQRLVEGTQLLHC